MVDDGELVWEAAWLRRDPAFDGQFFIAVRTTGIYCRCVCPVRLPFRRNVSFLPSAAAAEDAGYRPCLRCRPETAPFCPAWNGTRSTVQRAVRLIIQDGALDGEGATVEALAARLGITARHLSRLFLRHWGATPSSVARTARVQRAKRLLSETDLPMTAIALQAGFGSLRRFNAVFAEVYRRPPGAIRRWEALPVGADKCTAGDGPLRRPKRPFPNQGGTVADGGWMAGPDVIPGRCLKPCRRPQCGRRPPVLSIAARDYVMEVT